jgi:hypothetical protein
MQVESITATTEHRPKVAVIPEWYF